VPLAQQVDLDRGHLVAAKADEGAKGSTCTGKLGEPYCVGQDCDPGGMKATMEPAQTFSERAHGGGL